MQRQSPALHRPYPLFVKGAIAAAASRWAALARAARLQRGRMPGTSARGLRRAIHPIADALQRSLA